MSRMATSFGNAARNASDGNGTTAAGAASEKRMTSAIRTIQPASTTGRARSVRLIVVDMFKRQSIQIAQPFGKFCDRKNDQVAKVAVALPGK